MGAIKYNTLSDSDKLDLLRLLYHDLKKKDKLTARDLEQISLLVSETHRVYTRLKQKAH